MFLLGKDRVSADILGSSMALAAPADPALQAELAEITTAMEGAYGKGVYCPGDGEDCLDLPQMERMFAERRETDALLDVWQGWRTVSRPMRPQYQRFVELGNAGAVAIGLDFIFSEPETSADFEERKSPCRSGRDIG